MPISVTTDRTNDFGLLVWSTLVQEEFDVSISDTNKPEEIDLNISDKEINTFIQEVTMSANGSFANIWEDEDDEYWASYLDD
jgi:hypothetical protein